MDRKSENDSQVTVCFCILHYNNVEVTINCIEDILKNNSNPLFNVVVIDNGSRNGTGELLEEKYKNNKHVFVLKNDINFGFAKGNNIGYFFAKSKLCADIIVVMNSDILVGNTFSVEKIIQSCKSDVEIIAPDIVTINGLHQNPYRYKPFPKKRYISSLIKNFILLFAINLPVIGENLYLTYAERKNKKNSKVCKAKINKPIYNFVPHGSCLIYTNKWIKHEGIAFLPITFLYCEEEILYTYVQNKGYQIKYDPTLCIRHLEDASVNTSYENGKDKLIFQLKEQSKSIISYLKYLNHAAVR